MPERIGRCNPFALCRRSAAQRKGSDHRRCCCLTAARGSIRVRGGGGGGAKSRLRILDDAPRFSRPRGILARPLIPVLALACPLRRGMHGDGGGSKIAHRWRRGHETRGLPPAANRGSLLVQYVGRWLDAYQDRGRIRHEFDQEPRRPGPPRRQSRSRLDPALAPVQSTQFTHPCARLLRNWKSAALFL